MTELLIGCGHSRVKRMGLPGQPKEFQDLVTCDSNNDCHPDLLINLNNGSTWTPHSDTKLHDCVKYGRFVSFKESYFSEVHAYEVLEHLGQQGDVSSFFSTFANIWRILVPNGYLFATVPSRYSPWLWGDPGHTRAILPETLTFLSQPSYDQCGKTTMSDYRNIWRGDFNIIHSVDDKTFHSFVLQAIKPARIKV